MGTARRPPSSLGGQKPLTITERERASRVCTSRKSQAESSTGSFNCLQIPCINFIAHMKQQDIIRVTISVTFSSVDRSLCLNCSINGLIYVT